MYALRIFEASGQRNGQAASCELGDRDPRKVVAPTHPVVGGEVGAGRDRARDGSNGVVPGRGRRRVVSGRNPSFVPGAEGSERGPEALINGKTRRSALSGCRCRSLATVCVSLLLLRTHQCLLDQRVSPDRLRLACTIVDPDKSSPATRSSERGAT